MESLSLSTSSFQSAPDDIATISSTCFKLNSLQLRALLEKYQPAPDEPRIPQDLVDNVVAVSGTCVVGDGEWEQVTVELKKKVVVFLFKCLFLH